MGGRAGWITGSILWPSVDPLSRVILCALNCGLRMCLCVCVWGGVAEVTSFPEELTNQIAVQSLSQLVPSASFLQ